MELKIVESKWKQQIGQVLEGENMNQIVNTLLTAANLNFQQLRLYCEKNGDGNTVYLVFKGHRKIYVLKEL
jgi:hypothetical protein